VSVSGVTILDTRKRQHSAAHYEIEKWFYDYAENIEAVNIHYVCTPLGEIPDWNRQRATRFMPLVEKRLRRKVLKLAARILDPGSGELSGRYLLHHYFEIFADGDTHYSPLYTEEVLTGAGNLPASEAPADTQTSEPDSDRNRASAFGESAALTMEASALVSKNKPRRSKAKKGK
jgi:hypothetical protein